MCVTLTCRQHAVWPENSLATHLSSRRVCHASILKFEGNLRPRRSNSRTWPQIDQSTIDTCRRWAWMHRRDVRGVILHELCVATFPVCMKAGVCFFFFALFRLWSSIFHLALDPNLNFAWIRTYQINIKNLGLLTAVYAREWLFFFFTPFGLHLLVFVLKYHTLLETIQSMPLRTYEALGIDF